MDSPSNIGPSPHSKHELANLLCLHESGLIQCVLCQQLFDGLFERFCTEKTLSKSDKSILNKYVTSECIIIIVLYC
jgi:hypothetical protein